MIAAAKVSMPVMAMRLPERSRAGFCGASVTKGTANFPFNRPMNKP
jgi:hypothetical protein